MQAARVRLPAAAASSTLATACRTGDVIMKRTVLLLGIIFLVNAATYLLICRPDFELRQSDPAGYRQLNAARAHAGGLWSISPEQRCLVHCGVATAVVIAAALVAYVVARFIRRSRLGTRAKT